jgi:hypothetical protein
VQNDTCTYMRDLRKEYDVQDNNSKLSPTKEFKQEISPSVIQPISIKTKGT